MIQALAEAAGVHVTVMAANARTIGFYLRPGFRPIEVAEPAESGVVYLGRGL